MRFVIVDACNVLVSYIGFLKCSFRDRLPFLAIDFKSFSKLSWNLCFVFDSYSYSYKETKVSSSYTLISFIGSASFCILNNGLLGERLSYDEFLWSLFGDSGLGRLLELNLRSIIFIVGFLRYLIGLPILLTFSFNISEFLICDMYTLRMPPKSYLPPVCCFLRIFKISSLFFSLALGSMG